MNKLFTFLMCLLFIGGITSLVLNESKLIKNSYEINVLSYSLKSQIKYFHAEVEEIYYYLGYLNGKIELQKEVTKDLVNRAYVEMEVHRNQLHYGRGEKIRTKDSIRINARKELLKI